MSKSKTIIRNAVISAAAMSCATLLLANAQDQFQTAEQQQAPPQLTQNLCSEAERSIFQARQAEKRGDTYSTAEAYTSAISLLQSVAPVTANLAKVTICDEPLPSIGRRMVYYRIKALHEELAKSQPMYQPDALVKDLHAAYGKMAAIEKDNPTWKYLDGLGYAADGDYRNAFQKCREAATSPGGDESVRQKARSLAAHIKDGALQQEQMKEEDQTVYQEYVRSGAQALDFAMVSARTSADSARSKGNTADADMWQRRYDEIRKQREQIKIK